MGFAADLFSAGKKFWIGMVHLPPLPGSPGYRGSMKEILRSVRCDGEILLQAGAAGLMIENFGDTPFFPDAVPPETVAALAVAAAEAAKLSPPALGINVLRNDAPAALGIAAAVGARFIRCNVHTGAAVTDQGIISGRAAWTARKRSELGLRVEIWADVLVKHAAPLVEVSPEEIARDTARRGRADVLVVSGAATGRPLSPELLERVGKAVPECPVVAGSGISAGNLKDYFGPAAGFIVGTSLKRGGRTTAPVSRRRADGFARAWEKLAGRG